jgi:hypothetical protein
MSSFRQIEANRGNALKNCGPTTEDGKRRSRRNAVRHGLTAETIIVALEDIEDYEAFEAAITLDYDARSSFLGGFRTTAPVPVKPSRSAVSRWGRWTDALPSFRS